MEIKAETMIAARPDVVFEQLIDIRRWPDNIPGIARIDQLTEGPVGVGTRFRETRTMFGREETVEMTVVEISAPHRFVLTAYNHGTAFRAVHRLEPAEGGSRLTLAFDCTPKALVLRLLAPLSFLMRGSIAKQLAADLAALKLAAEQVTRA